MDDAFKQIKLKMRKYKIGSWKIKPVNIFELIYADGIVLFARSQANMQRNLEILNSELLTRNKLINHGKTKIMMIGRSKKSCIVKLMGKYLKQVQNFKYLGVIINENGKIEEEINTTMLNAGELYHAINKGFLGKKEISQKIKIAIYSSTYIPTLLYGSESWVITEKQKQNIQTAEMKYLRRVIGKTRRDKI
jgi:hypothetical protein